MSTPASSIPAAIRDRISAPAQPRVWTPEDFADLGPRTAVDQALHRLVASRNLRRIARGFYDTPQDNRLTGKPTYPNPRDVIDALARKGKVRVVVDGLSPRSVAVQQAAVNSQQAASAAPVDPPKKPVRKQSVFLGASRQKAGNEKPRDWDESEWIE